MGVIPRDEGAIRDEDLFLALDLRRRDLAKVRRHFERGDLPAAKAALVNHFRLRGRPRWFLDFRGARRGAVVSSWSGGDGGDLSRANELLENRFSLGAGKLWDFGRDLKWRTAEMRGRGSPPSSFKRGNFFRFLAAAHRRTGEPKYAVKFAELVDRWVTDWPLVVDLDFGPRGALFSREDGHKAMPTAQRVLCWLDCIYSGIPFAPEVSTDTAFRLIRTTWFTALQYRRYEKSPYVPANHHLWERGTAPFLFGMAMPEFPELAKLVDQGRPVVAKHVAHSFLDDGGYEERTTSYSLSALQMFLVPLRLAALNRVPLLDAGQKRRLRRCLDNLARMTMPNGVPPDIGDGVQGSSQRLARGLAMGAELLKSDVACEVAKRLRLKKHADPDVRRALSRATSVDLPLAVHYPKSGFFVARDGWSTRASAMALSVPGPGLPNHAHDDALSLQLVVRGVPMVGTPMSALYSYLQQDRYRNRKSLIRGHYHAMTSHNVVLAGGEPVRSVSELAEDWKVEPTPVQTEWREIDVGVQIVSSHRGYPGLEVTREVRFRHRKGWTVCDRVKGKTTRAHVTRWHFEYGVEVAQTDKGFEAFVDGVCLGIRLDGERVRARLYRDNQWLRENPLRPGEAAPWVLDLRFGGTGDDAVEMEFTIVKSR